MCSLTFTKISSYWSETTTALDLSIKIVWSVYYFVEFEISMRDSVLNIQISREKPWKTENWNAKIRHHWFRSWQTGNLNFHHGTSTSPLNLPCLNFNWLAHMTFLNNRYLLVRNRHRRFGRIFHFAVDRRLSETSQNRPAAPLPVSLQNVGLE